MNNERDERKFPLLERYYQNLRAKISREVLLVLIFALAASFLTIKFDIHDQIYRFSRAYEDYELDEIITLLFIFGFAFLLFYIHKSTKMKREIEKQKEVEKKLFLTQSSVDTASTIIFWITPEGKFIFANDAACKKFGYSREELIGMTVPELAPDHTIDMRPALWKQYKELKSLNFETRLRTKDGKFFPAEVTSNYVEFEGKEYEFAFALDITERKLAEKALKESESRYRGLFEDSPVSLWEEDFSALKNHIDRLRESGITDFRDYYQNNPEELRKCSEMVRVLDVNRETINLLKYSREELRNISLYEIFREESYHIFLDELVALSEGKTHFEAEVVNQTKYGRRLFVSLRLAVMPGFEKTWSKVLISLTDITAQKEAEKELLFTQFSVEHACDAVYLMDSETKFTYVNEAACKMLGYTREEFLSMSVSDIDARYSKNRLSEICGITKQSGLNTVETVHRAKDGRLIPVEVTGSCLEFEGKGYCCAFVRDITERKKAEENLRLAQFTIEKSSEAAFWIDRDAKFFYGNEALFRLHGYSKEELLSMTVFDVNPNFSRKNWEDHWQDLKKQGGSSTFESEVFTKDGRTLPAEISANILEFEGKEFNCGFTRDITERKKAEEELHKYEHIVSTSNDLLSLIDRNYIYQAVNDAYLKIFNKKREEVIGHTVAKIFGEDVFQKVLKPRIDRALAGEKIRYQHWFDFPGHGKRYLDAAYNPYIGEDDKIKGIVVSSRDITKSKLAQDEITKKTEQIRKSESFLNIIIDKSPYPMWISDNKGVLLRLNQALRDLLGITDDDVVGKYNILKDNIVEEQGFLPLVRDVFEKGKTARFNIEWDSSKLTHLRLKTRKSVILDVTISPVFDLEGKVINAICQHKDITDLVRFQEKIQASLEEKELLLKEIHHRVKNNMQIISSILHLQSVSINDKETLETFNECQDRIKSMALIHDKLYQTRDLSNINFKEYIENLTKTLFSSYKQDGKEITLELDIKDVFVDIDTAVPLGLIINELVSNSLKHGFKGKKEGRIGIMLSDIDKNMFELRVSDNGIGIPESIDIRNTTSLGLHIVTLLAEQQLRGKIDLRRNRGTEFYIVLKRVKYKKRI